MNDNNNKKSKINDKKDKKKNGKQLCNEVSKEQLSIPFSKLNLHESILFSLFIQKYFFCANIQNSSIPLIIKKENILLHSETGSGKTLCFVIPLLQNILNKKYVGIKKETECANVSVIDNTKNEPLKTTETIEVKNVEVIKNDNELEKAEKKSMLLYDEDSVKHLYNKVMNININQKNNFIDINVDNFISYTKKTLTNENLSKVNVTNNTDEKNIKNDHTSDNGYGNGDGNDDGNGDGNDDGNGDGNDDGNGDGNDDGNGDGNDDGNGDGNDDGNGDGNDDGNGDGKKKITKNVDITYNIEKADCNTNKVNDGTNINDIVRSRIIQSLCCNKKKNQNTCNNNNALNIYSIIITPTRELCIQIYNIINKFLFFIRLYFCNKYNIDFKLLNADNFFIHTFLFRGAVKIDHYLLMIENEKKKYLKNNNYKNNSNKNNSNKNNSNKNNSNKNNSNKNNSNNNKINAHQIIVATPGKLAMLLKEHKNQFDTTNLEYLILDEGDKLLEESYINHVNNIVNNIDSNNYCSCICSASCLYEDNYSSLFCNKKKKFITCINNVSNTNNISNDINSTNKASIKIQQTGLNNNSNNITDLNPKTYCSEDINKSFLLPNVIDNYYITLRNIDKSWFLFKFLNTVVRSGETAIVFFSTCFCVDFYFYIFKNLLNITKKTLNDIFNKIKNINDKYNKIYTEKELIMFAKLICYIQKYKLNNKFKLLKIHRKLKDKKRINAYKHISLTNSKNYRKIIFCTDVMSRGININIQTVISFDVANKNTTYIHRSGRTGRFGEKGKNIIFLNKKEIEYIYFLKNKNVKIMNFKKTNMYADMVKQELFMMQNEKELTTTAFNLIQIKNNSNPKVETVVPSLLNDPTLLFYSKCNENCSKIKIKKKKHDINDINEINNGDKENNTNSCKCEVICENFKNENILLLNNIINLFLKYIIFYVIEHREMFLLSTKAFLSYIEFYKNHQLNFLFPFHKLNLTHLCYSFALIKVPKFKEKRDLKNFKTININTFDIPFKNEEKEKRRQENEKNKKKELAEKELAEKELAEKELAEKELAKKNMSKKDLSKKDLSKKDLGKKDLGKTVDGIVQGEKGWKNKKNAQNNNDDNYKKKKKKKKTITQKKHEKREIEEDELESLFYEEKLYKKLKKNKITQKEYDELLDVSSLDKILTTTTSTISNTSKIVPKKQTKFVKTVKKKITKRQKAYNLKKKKRKRLR
ncbi:ATP-dependent rRNA helicase SPB4, putative [Hepatocystis sp. ex Piliocolobus tephrosceles]|nr:ATP-dependent rRNA helicase SPB4, putative [Hepatocystis sp. ex Piliocolobus tephrosceles]